MALAEPVQQHKLSGTLRLRILSALVMAPVALAAVWFGSPFLPLLTLVAGALMAWEWARLCGGGAIAASGHAVIATVPAAIAVAAMLGPMAALGIAAAGAVLAFCLGRRDGIDPAWLTVGTLWIAIPCVLLLWLSSAAIAGRPTVLWILAIVWATDIGAYAAGRQFGGPKLAPRWSPNKTWTGLLGGAAGAALAGVAAGHLAGARAIWLVALVSAGLAIVEQFGDLAESVAKRRFGVKDSSRLIPGHGGLLDRLDGLLAVIPAVALLTAVGGSFLEWR